MKKSELKELEILVATQDFQRQVEGYGPNHGKYPVPAP
jgi:hypothetical protein